MAVTVAQEHGSTGWFRSKGQNVIHEYEHLEGAVYSQYLGSARMSTNPLASGIKIQSKARARADLPALIKRGLDVAVSLALLILLAPMLMMIAAALRIEGGPVLFTQSRVGRADSRFACFKFRTMRPGAEAHLEALLAADPVASAEWAAHQKLRNDPRITPLGRFLRQSSLDELPQLINVLRGEMSMVGPRPIIAPEVEGYPADHAYHASPAFAVYARCMPGVTGLWQVSGRHETTHRHRIELDQVYAKRRSLALDVGILWRTVRVVLARTGV